MDTRRIGALGLTVVLGLTACNQGPDTHVGSLGADVWADRLCLSVGEFVNDMRELVEDGGGGFASAAATSDDQARTILLRARRWAPRVVESVDQLAVNVIDTGPPSRAEQAIFETMVTDVQTLQTSLHTALVTLRTLDLASVTPEEVQQLNDTLASINAAFDTFGGDGGPTGATAGAAGVGSELPDTPTCAEVDAQLASLST